MTAELLPPATRWIRRGATVIVALSVVFLVSGCTSMRGGERSAPEWVLSPPLGDATHEYFVGAATDVQGDEATAVERARRALVAEIIDFTGVRATGQSSSEARSALEAFQASLEEALVNGSHGSGLSAADRWVERQGTLITVYILGRYDRASLLSEQARLAAIFHEQVRPVAGPERDGDQLMAVGSVYRALSKYVDAAVSLAGESGEGAETRFQRVIGKATNALERLQVQKLNDNLTGLINQPFTGDFLVRAELSHEGTLMPVRNLPLSVDFETVDSSGKRSPQSRRVMTDGHGIARFTHPIPAVVGQGKVTMRVDLASILEPLAKVPPSERTAVEKLRRLAAQKVLHFSYSVTSKASSVPTSVVVLDTDNAGNPTGEADAQAGLQAALVRAGFTVPGLAIDPVRLKGRSDAAAIAALKLALDASAPKTSSSTATTPFPNRRVAFGTVRIEGFTENGGYVVTVGGTVKVADLRTGRILYIRTLATRSRGDNASSAIAAAFRSIGEKFGEDIARTLP